MQLSVQMVSFNSIRSWTEHLVPILISFYIGSWSDHFGIYDVILLHLIVRLDRRSEAVPGAVHGGQAGRGSVQPPERHLPGGVEPVGRY